MVVSYLSSSEQDALLAAAQVCATFSLMGSLFIVVCFARYKNLRKLSFTLVLFLAISDIGADVTYFMGNPEDNRAACVTQGALQQFFQMAQILWTVAIAWVLHDVTVNLRMYHPHEQKSLMCRFHFAVWGFSLISMILPFTTNSYGTTGSWCWIETNRDDFDVGTMWRYLVLYIPLWSAIIFNIVVYVRIVRVVQRFSTSIDDGGTSVGPSADQQARMKKFMRRLVWYPVVLIASWTFATINRIQNAADRENPIFGLFLLHTSLVTFQGFLNSLVYGSTDAVKSAVAQELLVERCFKAVGIGRGDGGDNSGAAGMGGVGVGAGGKMELDPEDEQENSSGVGMTDLRYDNNDDLGGFGDPQRNASGWPMTGAESSLGGARVAGLPPGKPRGDEDEDDDSVEVYNASENGAWQSGTSRAQMA